MVESRYHLKEGKPQKENWTFLYYNLQEMYQGDYVRDFICNLSVMVSYFSHHWSVMMSWCHLFGSPWRHHIPMMVGNKYAIHWVLDQWILGPSMYGKSSEHM